MHDIIEHYGKVVIALAGVLAAVLLTAAVVTIVTDRTKGAVSDISYKEHIYDAIDASRPSDGESYEETIWRKNSFRNS